MLHLVRHFNGDFLEEPLVKASALWSLFFLPLPFFTCKVCFLILLLLQFYQGNLPLARHNLLFELLAMEGNDGNIPQVAKKILAM